MSQDYQQPLSGNQPNPYSMGTENYDRFHRDRGNLEADEQRHSASNTGGSVGGGIGAGDAVAGAVVVVGAALALYGVALYWFYTETRLGRWWWRGEKKVLRFAVITFVLLYTVPPLIFSVTAPVMFIYDPPLGETLEDVWILLVLLIPLYFIAAAIRAYVGRMRAKTATMQLEDANPTAVIESGTRHTFVVAHGIVTNTTSVGTRKMPGYRIDLQGSNVPRITVPLQDAPAPGTRLQWAAPTNSTARPVLLFDATNGRLLFKQLIPPWTPPGAKRIIIGSLLVAAAIWCIGLLWMPFMMHFSSRVIAVVALAHTLFGIVLLFRLPSVIKQVLSRSPAAAQTYARDFLDRLTEQVTKMA